MQVPLIYFSQTIFVDIICLICPVDQCDLFGLLGSLGMGNFGSHEQALNHRSTNYFCSQPLQKETDFLNLSMCANKSIMKRKILKINRSNSKHLPIFNALC